MHARSCSGTILVTLLVGCSPASTPPAVVSPVAAPPAAVGKPAPPAGEQAALAPPALATPAGPAEAGASGAAIPISFDDLVLGLTADTIFNYTQLTDRARELDGKEVTIRGFMDAGTAQLTGIKWWVLLRQRDCPYGPGGLADHVMEVRMQGDARASYQEEPVTATGTLRIRPYRGRDGNTWSIYTLECRRVEQ